VSRKIPDTKVKGEPLREGRGFLGEGVLRIVPQPPGKGKKKKRKKGRRGPRNVLADLELFPRGANEIGGLFQLIGRGKRN